jgi:hypothetical protein
LHVGEVPCGAEKHTGRMQSARAGDGPRERGGRSVGSEIRGVRVRGRGGKRALAKRIMLTS